MFRLATILTILILLILAAPGTGASERHEVVQREFAWADAMRAKDMAALRDIMAPDFRLTVEEIPEFMLTIDNGEPVPGTPRSRWLANLEDMSFGPVEISNVNTVNIASDLVAVNMWMYLEDWRGPDGTIPALYELTDIWLNRDGQWRVITRYSRPLDPSTPRPKPEYVADR